MPPSEDREIAALFAHPSWMFDIGEHEGEKFLSMELVDGPSLSKRMAAVSGGLRCGLPLSEIVELVTQICAGLQAAHRSGVVHCDLKPDNILIASDGRVVVTDFGIARALLQSAAGNQAATASGSEPAGRAGRSRRPASAVQFDGTPMYISPEQLNGEAVDGRADLYSLGAVLYELLTGEAPFSAGSTVAVLAARLLRPPPDPRGVRPELGPEIAQVVMRCLALKPAERFASAAELATALQQAVARMAEERTQILHLPRSLSADENPASSKLDSAFSIDAAVVDAETTEPSLQPGGGPFPKAVSLVVVPFENQGDSCDDDWATGVARELTDGLAALPGLCVYSQGAVLRWLSDPRDPLAAAQAMGAAWVVSGSLRRSGRQVRVTVRLVRVFDGVQVFSARHDCPESGVLALTEALSGELSHVLLPAEKPAPAPLAHDGSATLGQLLSVDEYLRARAMYERGDAASVQQSVKLLASGLSQSPGEPRLLMYYALALSRLWFYGDGDAAIQALAAAERLVAVQPRHAESHLAQATVRFQGADLLGALHANAKALAIRPDFAAARELHGRILIETGPIQAGMEQLATARRLDPALQRVVADQARVLALLGRPDRAHELLADRKLIEQTFAVQWILRGRLCLWERNVQRAAVYLKDPEIVAGKYPRARLLLQVTTRQRHVDPQEVLAAGLASDKSSPRGRAFFFQMHAELFSFFGQPEQAVRSVARSVDAGLTDLLWLERCPLLSPLSADPRMAALRQVVYSRAFAVREALASLPALTAPSLAPTAAAR